MKFLVELIKSSEPPFVRVLVLGDEANGIPQTSKELPFDCSSADVLKIGRELVQVHLAQKAIAEKESANKMLRIIKMEELEKTLKREYEVDDITLALK